MIQRPLTRRLITIPVVLALFVASWVGAPLLIPLALLVDLARWTVTRRPWMATRLVLFLMAYTLAELVGIAGLGVTWLVSGGGKLFDLRPSTFAIQKAWAGFVLSACRIIFGLTIDARGLDAVDPAPFVLIARHASIVDNLLPAWFVSRPHGIHIRYVMKQELLVDPALDIAGHRLVNLFVRRGSGDSESEVAAVRRLAATLPDDEAVLIYPEGTRFSEAKRQRSLAILARRSPRLHAKVAGLTHLLPPRLGGTLALLDGCQADVVVMCHRGLDGFARVADIWRGAMVRRRVDVEFWRIPRSQIPAGRTERADWLFDLWTRVDGWVGGQA
ncbi:MAG: 1-acyl-sn-glycerol-3-phosphate acyltransferase [Acidimicrobiia bacterium]|nr:1-acyl-sn-glycerol-3-phosphate acyltransferase [Acidimicrobiia bacterium]